MSPTRATSLRAAATRWALAGLIAIVALDARPDAAEQAKISTRVTARGEVVATITLAAAPAAVRQVLSSAERSHALAPSTVSAKATAEGKCERVKLKTRGLFAPFEIETRRCPTASGWRETLIASTNFVEYWNEWVIEDAAGGGARVTFRTRTVPNVAVPEAIIHAETRRVLAKLLHNLSAAVREG